MSELLFARLIYVVLFVQHSAIAIFHGTKECNYNSSQLVSSPDPLDFAKGSEHETIGLEIIYGVKSCSNNHVEQMRLVNIAS